jgi:hypothetical protein
MNKLKIKIEQHLELCAHDICTILMSGRRDIDAIAILLTEAFFRDSQIRIYELIIFKIFKYIYCSRANLISLGMAQVQARHWRIPINLFRILSPITAYDVTIRYWDENKWLGLPFSKKITRHVGELRFYYLNIAMRCRDEAQKWALQLTDPYPVEAKKANREAEGTCHYI